MSGADHERCGLNFAYDHGVTLSVNSGAQCRAQCGARATLDRVRFPESARLGRVAAPRIFEDPEFFFNAACDKNSLTTSAAPVPRPSIASGTNGGGFADASPAEGHDAGSTPESASNRIEQTAIDPRQDISRANRPAEDDYAMPVLVSPVLVSGEPVTTRL
jgi:hypothetical protein